MINSVQDLGVFLLAGFYVTAFDKSRQTRFGGILIMVRHLPAIDWSFDARRCVFFLIWHLIINSIDIEWIMLKEFIDGSMDYTCTFIRGNPGKRVLRPPLWFQSPSDVFA
jgi:hypothetical protein